jgi:hypothetical protein
MHCGGQYSDEFEEKLRNHAFRHLHENSSDLDRMDRLGFSCEPHPTCRMVCNIFYPLAENKKIDVGVYALVCEETKHMIHFHPEHVERQYQMNKNCTVFSFNYRDARMWSMDRDADSDEYTYGFLFNVSFHIKALQCLTKSGLELVEDLTSDEWKENFEIRRPSAASTGKRKSDDANVIGSARMAKKHNKGWFEISVNGKKFPSFDNKPNFIVFENYVKSFEECVKAAAPAAPAR